MSTDLRKQLDEMAARWRTEVDARLAAEVRLAALSASFRKIVKRWRDELDELLKDDKP